MTVSASAHSFVDRDMVMRYHYGLGVGHVYAQRQASGAFNQSAADRLREHVEESSRDFSDPETSEREGSNCGDLDLEEEEDEEDEEEGREDKEDEEEGGEDEDFEDEEILAMEMYGC
jgi:hypothetical protein